MAKTNNAVIALTFSFERETKNTIRFQEVLADSLDTPQIGTLYVAKAALKSLGWKDGKNLSISLSVK